MGDHTAPDIYSFQLKICPPEWAGHLAGARFALRCWLCSAGADVVMRRVYGALLVAMLVVCCVCAEYVRPPHSFAGHHANHPSPHVRFKPQTAARVKYKAVRGKQTRARALDTLPFHLQGVDDVLHEFLRKSGRIRARHGA